jgi:predicted methyltransferase
MKNALLGSVRLVGFACLAAATFPACESPPEKPPAPAVVDAALAKPAEPTAEEKQKAERAKALAEARAKGDAAIAKETARWTPALHAEAKALVDKKFPTGKAAIQAVIASKVRQPEHAARDQYRHPVETLDFFGFKPTLTVLEYGPGEGWYTELLAPALAKSGKLFTTSPDPAGPPDARSTYSGQLWKSRLAISPELYGKVETIVVDDKAPSLPMDGTLDMVFLAREVHGMTNAGTIDAWLSQFNKALKMGGLLVVVQHRAKPDAKAEESAKNGYLPEAWVIAKIEAEGFKLVGKSEINANPKDTKDYADGVWSLPPTFAAKDDATDHAKYAAIGESDRMTLKFKKVAKVAAKPVVPPAKGDAVEKEAEKMDAPKTAAPKMDAPAAPAKPAAPAAPKTP